MDTGNNKIQYSSKRYVEGSTARKLNAAPDIRREKEQYGMPLPRRQEQKQTRTLQGINIASLFILMAAVAATVYICIGYLQLQNEVAKMDKEIVTKERELTDLTNKNNAKYELINTEYDLDYVYKVAANELGMVYPDKNKVITYKKGKENYVRQYQNIPEKN